MLLQSDDSYPLVYVEFYGVTSSNIKKFSRETFTKGISISKGSRSTFVFTAVSAKGSHPTVEVLKITDFCMMLMEFVVLESGDANGPTQLQFQKLKDAYALYHSLGNDFQREFLDASNHVNI